MTKLAERVEKLRNFFEPVCGITVISALDKKGKLDNAIIINLTKGSIKTAIVGKAGLFKKVDEPKGFDGNIYTVNIRAKPGDKIGGLPAYKYVLDIPALIDHAIIVVSSNMRDSDKPVSYALLGLDSQMSSFYLDDHSIPEVSFPDRCVKEIKALINGGKFLKKQNLL